MAGLRMPRAVKLVIPKRKKMTLREEVAVLWRFATAEFVNTFASLNATLKKQAAGLRSNIVCGGCQRRLTARAQYQYDHEIARELGGSDKPENIRPYCVTMTVGDPWDPMIVVGCHPLKTKRDAALIAKARRLSGQTCAGPTRHPIKSRNQWPPKGSRKLRSRPMRGGRK